MVYRKSFFSYLLPMEIQACIKAYYNNRIRMADSPVDTEGRPGGNWVFDWRFHSGLRCINVVIVSPVIMESNDPISRWTSVCIVWSIRRKDHPGYPAAVSSIGLVSAKYWKIGSLVLIKAAFSLVLHQVFAVPDGIFLKTVDSVHLDLGIQKL